LEKGVIEPGWKGSWRGQYENVGLMGCRFVTEYFSFSLAALADPLKEKDSANKKIRVGMLARQPLARRRASPTSSMYGKRRGRHENAWLMGCRCYPALTGGALKTGCQQNVLLPIKCCHSYSQ